MFWTCDENSAENSLTFQLLQYSAAQSQGHLSFLCCPATEGSGAGQLLGEGMTRTADLNWPRECPVLCGVVLKSNSGGTG